MQLSSAPSRSSFDEAYAVRVALSESPLERLAVGARALMSLLRNPDDTRNVFVLGMVANGPAFPRMFLRFAISDEGDRLLRERPSIDAAHIERAALRALPEDTLGGAYARYLDDNGLDPDLFDAPPGLTPIVAYVSKRARQTHDIWHVLTGYRPDIAGELALQAFSFAQTGMPSAALIATFGSLRFAPKKPGIVPMAFDGFLRGKQATYLLTVPWEQMWTRKLDDVRRELGIRAARVRGAKLESQRAIRH